MTPVEPPKKAIGRNTADSDMAIATSAIWISRIDFDGRFPSGHSRIFMEQSFDVLDHDDGVVDQQPDRQRQAEQGHVLMVKPAM